MNKAEEERLERVLRFARVAEEEIHPDFWSDDLEAAWSDLACTDLGYWNGQRWLQVSEEPPDYLSAGICPAEIRD